MENQCMWCPGVLILLILLQAPASLADAASENRLKEFLFNFNDYLKVAMTQIRNSWTPIKQRCMRINNFYDISCPVSDSMAALMVQMKPVLDSVAAPAPLPVFRKPSFVSDWFLMQAQYATLSKKIITHGLGTIPYKVEVQIRTLSGDNLGWIFHGDSAFQSDDDTNHAYGGVVYHYDDTKVYLSAPKMDSAYVKGALVYTGEESGRRLGNNHEQTDTAYVRVKVFGVDDWPSPDFETGWSPLNVHDTSLSFHEINHGLGDYPAFVNVQIRCDDSGSFYISEGTGSLYYNSPSQTGGGTVWAFSGSSIRVWTGYIAAPSTAYSLYGSPNGWNTDVPYICNSGSFRALAWSRTGLVGSPTFHEHDESNLIFYETYMGTSIHNDDDLMAFYVQADSGDNTGFRFRGHGNAQYRPGGTFGGAVYAFHPSGDVRVWRPNPSNGGQLINVAAPYGNSQHLQSSDEGSYIMTVLKGARR